MKKHIAISFFCLIFANMLFAQGFQPKQIRIHFSTQTAPKTVNTLSFPWGESFQNDTLIAEMQWDEVDNRYLLRLRALLPIQLARIEMQASYETTGNDTRYFCNGFQSWTTSREYSATERIPRLAPMLNAYSKHAGDYYLYPYPRKKGQLHSWNWTYWRDGQSYRSLASVAENSGFTAFRFDTKNHTLHIDKDCEGYQLLADKSYEAFDLLYAELPDAIAYQDFMAEYARAWHEKYSSPTLATATPALGWTSWYYHYANIDETVLEQNLEAFSKRSIPIQVFQIDDGYQQAVGDWLTCNKKFPDGMEAMAEKIHQKGYKAGIWLAPFVASRKSEVFKNHPDWFVKDKKGRPLAVARNVIWKGPYYALDIYHPEARSHIQKVLKTIFINWKYDLIKVDFLFGVCLQPRPDRTRAQIMHDAMLLLREAAGPDKQILGCGVPLAQSFGLVDYCRIGNDAHLGWEFKALKGLHAHERPSTWSTLTNTIYRYALSGKFFQNDPDVFILRDKKTKLTTVQKNTMFLVNHLLGELLFTSDNIDEYSPKQLEQYRSGFPLRSKSNVDILPYSDQAYRVLFYIGIREYVAYINLGNKPVTLHRPATHRQYYDAAENYILEVENQKGISLQPFESKCYYVLNDDAIDVLGGTGHLFSGAEIDALEWTDNQKLTLLKHRHAQPGKSLFLLVRDEQIEELNINGNAYPVVKIGNYRGVEMK